jgi:hypothetical protein
MVSDKTPINTEEDKEGRPRSKRKSYVLAGVSMLLVLSIIIAVAVMPIDVKKNGKVQF